MCIIRTRGFLFVQETLGENYSEDNPYRILVDKYEALLKIQQKHNAFTTMMPSNKDITQGGISLHEELQMSGQFSSFNGNASDSDDDEAVGCAATSRTGGGSVNATACCKYSETETTSSSGFSDETSNKCTQTETFFTGSFLCTISDGDDCRFSIYDDASPIESRFRKTPEYRQLFREIFAVLKRAAEAKDEGEKLPLLQDEKCVDDDDDDNAECLLMTANAAPKVPPATPACDVNPFIETLEQQLAATSAIEMMTTATVAPATTEHQQRPPAEVQPKPPQHKPVARDDDRQHVLLHQEQPQKQVRRQRDIIEELAATVKHKKHVRHRKSSKHHSNKDISHLMEYNWTDQVTRRQHKSGTGTDDSRPSPTHRATWCVSKDAVDAQSVVGHEYASSASQEVAKLKLLEKSYAEVLRHRKPPARQHWQNIDRN